MCNTPVAQQLTVYEPAAQGGVHCQHKPSTFNFQRQLRSKSQALPQCSASLGSTTLLTPFGAPFGTLTFNSVRSSPWEFDFQLPLSIPFEAPFGAPTFNFHFQLRSKLPLGVRLSTSTFNSVRSSFRSSHFQLPLSTPFEAPLGSSTFNSVRKPWAPNRGPAFG